MNHTDDAESGKRKREPFAAIPWHVVDAKLSPHDLAVYVAIVRHANRNGQCWPSVDKLAEVAVVTTRFVRDSVKRLQGRGLLTITPKVNRPHVYTLNMVQGTLNTVQGEDEYGSGHPEYGSPELEPLVEPLVEPLKKSAAKAATRSKKSGCEVPIPEALDTPEFKEQWNAWITHLRESRKSLSKTSAALQLSELCEWGLDRAIAAIRHSIRKGYKGIYEPNGASNKPTSARAQPGTGAGVKYDPNASTDPTYGVF